MRRAEVRLPASTWRLTPMCTPSFRGSDELSDAHAGGTDTRTPGSGFPSVLPLPPLRTKPAGSRVSAAERTQAFWAPKNPTPQARVLLRATSRAGRNSSSPPFGPQRLRIGTRDGRAGQSTALSLATSLKRPWREASELPEKQFGARLTQGQREEDRSDW